MDKIVTEFIQTERVYCSFLSLALEYFFNIAPVNGIKNEKDTKLFLELKTNWSQLHEFHKSFLLTLETRCLMGGSHASGAITESGSVSVVAIPTGNTQDDASTDTITLKRNSAQGLANVVIKLSPYFKLYSGYCRIYPLMIPIFEEAQENSNDFKQAVEHFESLPRAKNLSLGSILVKPVQRVCKYELFLRDLQKKVPPSNVGLMTDVVMAYTATQNVVAKVNETGKTAEQLAKLAELQEQLRPLGKVNILESHRRLDLQGNAMAIQMLPNDGGGGSSGDRNSGDRNSGGSRNGGNVLGISHSSHSSRGSGVVLVDGGVDEEEGNDVNDALNQPLSISSAEPVHIFLVSDILLICRYKFKKKGLLRSNDKHRYHVAHQIPLTSASVSPIEESTSLSQRGIGTSALEITTLDGKSVPWYVLSFATTSECGKWMEHICLSIDKIKCQAKQRKKSIQSNRLKNLRKKLSNNSIGGSGGSSGGGNDRSFTRNVSVNNINGNSGVTKEDNGSNSSSNGGSEFVDCPHCLEGPQGVPESAHVMKCHFCSLIFLYRPGRRVGKPVFNDGNVGIVSKSGLFGR
jgi:hypothetical protein